MTHCNNTVIVIKAAYHITSKFTSLKQPFIISQWNLRATQLSCTGAVSPAITVNISIRNIDVGGLTGTQGSALKMS